MNRKTISLLAMLTAVFAMAPRSEAHAVVRINFAALHASHKVAISPQLLTLLKSSKGNTFLTSALSGPGSLSTKAFALQNKTIATNSFGNGAQTVVINEIVKEGLVTNGNLPGTFYSNSGGSTYLRDSFDGPLTLAVGGNNSFNVFGTGLQAFVGAPAASAFTFTKIAGAAGPTIKLTPLKGSSSLTILSGSERARLNQINALANKSFALGEKSVVSLGPVTGGEFAGAFYENDTAGHTYFIVRKSLYAFGSDSLNQTTLNTIQVPNAISFLTFASGATRTITSAEIFGTFYIPNAATRIPSMFALGSDFRNLTPANFTAINNNSFIFF